MLKISAFTLLNIILGVVILGFGLNELYLWIMGKRSAKTITEEEFREGMRRAQVLDVREKDAFTAGHILGARSLAYTTLSQTMSSIRKDMPIYLYDARRTMAVRTAVKLKKNGFTDVYILKGGYNKWSGKTKKGN